MTGPLAGLTWLYVEGAIPVNRVDTWPARIQSYGDPILLHLIGQCAEYCRLLLHLMALKGASILLAQFSKLSPFARYGVSAKCSRRNQWNFEAPAREVDIKGRHSPRLQAPALADYLNFADERTKMGKKIQSFLESKWRRKGMKQKKNSSSKKTKSEKRKSYQEKCMDKTELIRVIDGRMNSMAAFKVHGTVSNRNVAVAGSIPTLRKKITYVSSAFPCIRQ